MPYNLCHKLDDKGLSEGYIENIDIIHDIRKVFLSEEDILWVIEDIKERIDNALINEIRSSRHRN